MGGAGGLRSGTIDLQDGAIGDKLTINGNFAASGASILVVDFDNTTADVLDINGTVTGSTTINANHIGAGNIGSDPILVVDTDGAESTAFVLGTVGGNLVNVSVKFNHQTVKADGAVAKMNRFRFAKRFRAVTGETANQYVINRRLSAAATRLASSKAPIAEIAFEVGFNDISHFDACFRSAFGCAPSVWRRG